MLGGSSRANRIRHLRPGGKCEDGMLYLFFKVGGDAGNRDDALAL
jgi:hypothetical protein